MKVKDLILKLQSMPQDAIIIISPQGDADNPNSDPVEVMHVDIVWMIGRFIEYWEDPPIEISKEAKIAVYIQ